MPVPSLPLIIKRVDPGSCAARAGFRRGDRIVAINGEQVFDALDFGFLSAQESVDIAVVRHEAVRRLHLSRQPGMTPGLHFFPQKIRRCRNKCVFCFIDQMPPGLRKSLYIKDEDYLLSFTNGNYLTLAGFDQEDLERIAARGLSPLYISVHATNRPVRNHMLGNPHAPDIMDQLRFLAHREVAFHTQIVLCPGINDGPVLQRTLADLFSLGENLLSVALVPVGITRFRRTPLSTLSEQDTRRLCARISRMSDCDAAKAGRRRIFLADEIFLKAGVPVPPHAYYEDYPQIENGVGLIRQLCDEWRSIKKETGRGHSRSTACERRCLLLTSVSAHPYLDAIAHEVRDVLPGTGFDVHAVENSFFGRTVTVAGLLTARDIIRTAKPLAARARYDAVILPSAMFNMGGSTLDGWSSARIARALRTRIMVPDSLRAFCDFVQMDARGRASGRPVRSPAQRSPRRSFRPSTKGNHGTHSS